MRPTTSRNLILVPARLSVAIQLFCLMTMLSSATVAAELLEEAIDRSIDWQPIELVPAAQANLNVVNVVVCLLTHSRALILRPHQRIVSYKSALIGRMASMAF